MKHIITDEPYEILEVRPNNENGSISLVQKRRNSTVEEWQVKVVVLNQREALRVYKAISDIVLSPAAPYVVLERS